MALLMKKETKKVLNVVEYESGKPGVVIPVGLICMAIVIGCGRDENNVAPALNEQRPTSAGSQEVGKSAVDAQRPIDHVLWTLETSGAKEAAEELTRVDWDQELLSDISWLRISEGDIQGKPLGEGKKIATEAMQGLRKFKMVVLAALETSQELQKKGDTANAVRYVEAVKQLGGWLSSSDKIELVRMVGAAYVKKAQTELDGVRGD